VFEGTIVAKSTVGRTEILKLISSFVFVPTQLRARAKERSVWGKLVQLVRDKGDTAMHAGCLDAPGNLDSSDVSVLSGEEQVTAGRRSP